MIKPPSIQHEYTLVFSGDPALTLPDEQSAKELALRVARETGKWDALVKATEQPTLFTMRPLPGDSFAWLLAEMRRKDLSTQEFCELAFRLALRKIVNFGDIAVRHEDVDGHTMATKAALRSLYDVGKETGDQELGALIVLELGAYVINREREGISPK